MGEEVQHAGPVIGRSIGQPQGDAARETGLKARAFAQAAGGAPTDGVEALVEPPHATEARGEGDFSHGKTGLEDQATRHQQAAGLGDGDRGGAEMILEQASQVPFADPQAVRQILNVARVQGPEVNQVQGP